MAPVRLPRMTQRVQPRIALLAAVAALAGAIIALQVAGRTDTVPVTRGQWGAAAAVARAANMSIPPIFHHIFIADEAAEKMGLRFDEEGLVSQKPWIRSCKYMYQDAGWEYMQWNATSAHDLVATSYPKLLPIYKNLSSAVEKSDAFRYILMHKFGGLYQDGDIECWRFGGDMLAGADVVVQRTHSAEGVTNAMCASKPGVDLWTGAVELIGNRFIHDWGDTWVPYNRTGPRLLRDALVKWGLTPNKHGDYEHTENDVHGVRVKMYPAGQWLTPCQFWEQECRVNVQLRRANGTQDLTHLVGMHRYVGSWLPWNAANGGSGFPDFRKELCSSGEKKEGGRSLLCGRRPLSAGGSSGGGRGGGSSSWTRRLAEAVAQAFR